MTKREKMRTAKNHAKKFLIPPEARAAFVRDVGRRHDAEKADRREFQAYIKERQYGQDENAG